jgi:hypothetical protein
LLQLSFTLIHGGQPLEQEEEEPHHEGWYEAQA